MINSITGEIILGDIHISPFQTRSEFESSKVFSAAKEHTSNGPWISYVMDFPQGHTVIKFEKEKLFSLIIGFNLPDENTAGGWESWSQKNEKKRKLLHDQILRDELGSTFQVFNWGEVGSVADPKTHDASIFVLYK